MLNIYGLFAQDEMPVVALLERGWSTSDHINLVEIARSHFRQEASRGKVYDAIIIVVGSDESHVFSFK